MIIVIHCDDGLSVYSINIKKYDNIALTINGGLYCGIKLYRYKYASTTTFSNNRFNSMDLSTGNINEFKRSKKINKRK
jgi:hypothetical protein